MHYPSGHVTTTNALADQQINGNQYDAVNNRCARWNDALFYNCSDAGLTSLSP